MLGHLRSWQEQLASKQDECQTNVQEELLHIKSAFESSVTKPAEEHPIVPKSLFSSTCKPIKQSDELVSADSTKSLQVSEPVSDLQVQLQ